MLVCHRQSGVTSIVSDTFEDRLWFRFRGDDGSKVFFWKGEGDGPETALYLEEGLFDSYYIKIFRHPDGKYYPEPPPPEETE